VVIFVATRFLYDIMPIIYWFKNDLRLNGNEAHYCAVGKSKKLLCVYCIDPDAYGFLDIPLVSKTYRIKKIEPKERPV